MRTITWLTILISTLIVSGAQAAAVNFYTEPGLVTAAQVWSAGKDQLPFAHVRLERGASLYMSPTDSVENQAVFFAVPGYCTWEGNAVGLALINKRSNDVFWHLTPNQACNAAGITECNTYRAEAGLTMAVKQDSVATGGVLVCDPTP